MGKTDSRAWLCAGIILLQPWATQAAGLGRVSVHSQAAQPLFAEVEIEAEAPELEGLSARLGTADQYAEAKLPYPAWLARAEVKFISRETGWPSLQIKTKESPPDSALPLLVELTWASGRSERHIMMAPLRPTPAPVSIPATPATAAAPVAAPASSAPTNLEKEAATAEPLQPAEAAPTGTLYGPIRRGENLYAIARTVRPGTATVEQTMLALYQANPGAFSGQNMNRLQSGKVLRVPADAAIIPVSPAEASKLIRMHTADWQSWRNKVAAQAAPAPADQEAGAAATGRVVTKAPEESNPAGAGRDVLRLSRSGDTAGTGRQGAGKEAAITALQEETAAQARAIREAEEKIQQLEKTVGDLQKLLTLQSSSPATAVPENPAPQPAALAKPATQATTPQAPKTPDDTVFYGLLGGAGLAAAGLVGWLWSRRRRAGSATTHLPPAPGLTPPEPADSSERDPLTEAELHLAYGMPLQAEEVLTEALIRDPLRTDYLLKLLEIYAERENRDAFYALARQYEAAHPDREGEIWAQIAAMGNRLDPDNAFYLAADRQPVDLEMALVSEAPPSFVPGKPSQDSVSQDFQNMLFQAATTPAAGAAGSPEATNTESAETAAPSESPDPLRQIMTISLDEIPSFTSHLEREAASDPGLQAEAGITPPGEDRDPDAVRENDPDMDASEVDGRLELARAYLEMGDLPGAQEILQSVIAEGNAAQRAQAQAMLEASKDMRT